MSRCFTGLRQQAAKGALVEPPVSPDSNVIVSSASPGIAPVGSTRILKSMPRHRAARLRTQEPTGVVCAASS